MPSVAREGRHVSDFLGNSLPCQLAVQINRRKVLRCCRPFQKRQEKFKRKSKQKKSEAIMKPVTQTPFFPFVFRSCPFSLKRQRAYDPLRHPQHTNSYHQIPRITTTLHHGAHLTLQQSSDRPRSRRSRQHGHSTERSHCPPKFQLVHTPLSLLFPPALGQRVKSHGTKLDLPSWVMSPGQSNPVNTWAI